MTEKERLIQVHTSLYEGTMLALQAHASLEGLPTHVPVLLRLIAEDYLRRRGVKVRKSACWSRCNACNKLFVKVHKQVYCSEECRTEGERRLHARCSSERYLRNRDAERERLEALNKERMRGGGYVG